LINLVGVGLLDLLSGLYGTIGRGRCRTVELVELVRWRLFG
jgi:hypothetical protein